ncbi:MAG: hypothetical protein DBY32_02745 [Phascolarctobacterium sp.]|nr:MAG: hypothetical protein DBY32_02745 [Phascolarctobacterium sp.]
MKFNEVAYVYLYLADSPDDYKKSRNVGYALDCVERWLESSFWENYDELDLEIIKKFTCSDYVYCFNNIYFAWRFYKKHMEIEKNNLTMYKNFNVFLYIYGWELEHLFLEHLIKENKDINDIYRFCINLELYKNNKVYEMIEEDMDEYIKKLNLL